MYKKTSFLLIALSAFSKGATTPDTRQPLYSFKLITPENMTNVEYSQHVTLGAEVYFVSEGAILRGVNSTHCPTKERYYTFFEDFYSTFRQEKKEDFLVSAYDGPTLVATLYCRILKGPHAILGLKAEDKAYFIYTVVVSETYRRQRLAMHLFNQVNVLNTQNWPVLTYIYRDHTLLYDNIHKAGFKMITDEQHPDGVDSLAAMALSSQFEDHHLPVVAYRKN